MSNDKDKVTIKRDTLRQIYRTLCIIKTAIGARGQISRDEEILFKKSLEEFASLFADKKLIQRPLKKDDGQGWDRYW